MAQTTFVTDEAQGRSTFVNISELEGKLLAADVEKNRNPIASGRRAGELWSTAMFTVGAVTHCVMEDGSTPNEDTQQVRYSYAKWDDAKARPMAPDKRSAWFKVVVPAWAEVGIDLANPDSILSAINRRMTFEAKTLELGYEVVERDDDGNILPPTNAEDSNVVYDEETERWSDNAVFNKVPATGTFLLPVSIESEISEDDAYIRAAELYDGVDGDLAAFKKAAVADEQVQSSVKLKRLIQSGKYDREKNATP